MNLEILKNITEKLDEAEIRYNLTYTQKDKCDWDDTESFKIIVEETTEFETIMDILDIVDSVKARKYMKIKIDDSSFTFIKVNINDFGIATYYYSWEILTFMMIRMLRRLSIDFTDKGLYYNYRGSRIYLTNNIRYIIDFLYLDDDYYSSLYRKGFDDETDEIKYAMTSIYFNPEIFENIKIPEDNFFKDELNVIIKLIKANMPSVGNFHGFKEHEKYWDVIEAFFPGFLEKVYKLKAKYILK